MPPKQSNIYRSGVVPAEVQEESSSSSEEELGETTTTVQTGVGQVQDRRLQRLEALKVDHELDKDDRKIQREKALKRRQEQEREIQNDEHRIPEVREIIPNREPLKAPAAVVEYEASSSSEESSSEEEEDVYPKRVMFKPVFVPKTSRESTVAQEQAEKLAMKTQEKRMKEIEARKAESSELVVEALRKEMMEAQQELAHIELDDTDNIDDQEEIDAWKIRELLRIKRDREQREYRLIDNEDIERRRNMTDDQIAEENIKDGKLGVEKTSLKFMQKYSHSGAFFIGDEKVEEAKSKTDFNAPTLGDHKDMTALPAVMQVKKFGMKGNTKYTHLVDQDTTGLDTAWAKSANVSQSVMKKMGGMGSGFEKPTKKRKT